MPAEASARIVRFVAMVAVLWSLTIVPNRSAAQPGNQNSQPTRQFVFLAGTKDHGPPGRHEYEKDLRLLADCLEHSPNLHGVTTKVYVGKAPQDLSEVKDAAVFVILSSGDGNPKEAHPLFPPNTTTDGRKYSGDTAVYLTEFDKLVRKGAGVVVLHYAIQANNLKARDYYLHWLGGLWIPENYSQNPLGTWSITPIEAAREHPVLRGVRSWTYYDEIFCKFLAQPLDPRRTDLVLASTDRSNQGVLKNIVASWAYQRDDGGRGFVYGGVDVHVAMQTEDYRRLLLNGIVWAARMEVPEGGVQSNATQSQ